MSPQTKKVLEMLKRAGSRGLSKRDALDYGAVESLTKQISNLRNNHGYTITREWHYNPHTRNSYAVYHLAA